MKTKICLIAILLCSVIFADAFYWGFGHSPSTKVECKMDREKGAYTVTMLPDTPYDSSFWMPCVYPWRETGRKIKVSCKVQVTGARDPRAQATIGIQAANEKGQYIAAQSFGAKMYAAECSKEPAYFEFIFTIPDVKTAKKWELGKKLLVTIGGHSTNGTFVFSECKIEDVE